MSYEFRMPNVSGATTESQVQQLISFLRQHIQELNFAVRSLEGTRTEEQEVQDRIEKALAKRGL